MKSEELQLSESLFKPLTRTERQKEGLKEWIKHKCCAGLEYVTGFGKTFTAIMGIKILLTRFPELKVIVVVPTDGLQSQWISKLDKEGLSLNTEVLIINTAIKDKRQCDLLIIDEVHRTAADTFSQVFKKIKYKFILGLTGTLERLDGKHELIQKYCPIVDKVTYLEALANGWVAKSIEYKIILDVKDIDIYKEMTREFNSHYEYFNWNFKLVMACVGKDGYKTRIALRNEMCKNNPKLNPSDVLKTITMHATSFMRIMQARKKFINEHPDKLRLTREIIKARPNAKIITFSATIDIAEQIGVGFVYSAKQSKKKNKLTIEEFTQMSSGVLNTSKKADEGLDVPGINTLIILGQDSSPTRFTQRKGRSVRKEGDKVSEIFTFVIADTTENEWYKSSHRNDSSEVIQINETNLIKVLNGESYETYKKPIKPMTFRF